MSACTFLYGVTHGPARGPAHGPAFQIDGPAHIEPVPHGPRCERHGSDRAWPGRYDLKFDGPGRAVAHPLKKLTGRQIKS